MADTRQTHQTLAAEIRALRDRLSEKIFSGISHVHLNGDKEKRLPGNLNVSFEFVEGESLILGMQGVAVSTGSACSSAKAEPSHVLQALGRSEALHQSSLRFGLGDARILYLFYKMLTSKTIIKMMVGMQIISSIILSLSLSVSWLAFLQAFPLAFLLGF